MRPWDTGAGLTCSCEVVVPVAVDDPVELARRTASDRLQAVKADLRSALGV